MFIFPGAYWTDELEVSKIVVPQNGWLIMENLIKWDDLGVPYFRKHPTTTCGKYWDLIEHISLDSSDEENHSSLTCKSPLNRNPK